MVDASLMLSLVVYGVFLGLIYALMAIGITIIFGLMKLINFAHGEFYMLGGYVIYFITALLGVNSFVALPISFIVGFLVGQLVEYVAIRPMYTTRIERPEEYAIVITFGISLFLQNFALLFWGYQFKSPPSFIEGVLHLFTFSMSMNILVVAIASAAILGILLIFIHRTWYGLALKAVSQNMLGAAIAGINTSRTNNLVFGLGAALAGCAGALLAPTYMVYPLSGVFPALQSFVIVVLGGLGSIKGSLVSALTLGIVESVLGALLSSAYIHVYGFIILIAVLILRPEGLFGSRGRAY